MNRHKILTLSILLAAASLFGTSGCNTISNNPRTAGGAALGAGAGALVGGVVGHQTGHKWGGALIGGATGAAVGGVIGDQSDEQVRQRRRIEELERQRYQQPSYHQPRY